MKRRLLAVLVAFLAVGPAIAAGKPLAISLTPAAVTVTEGQGAVLALAKSGGNGKPSLVKLTTSDGSWSGSAYPGSSVTIPTIDDTQVNGTRTVTVTAMATTGASARATITVLDNDVAPPPAATWTKCADEGGTCSIVGTANVRYGAGTTWLTRSVTGSIACDNSTWGDPLVGTFKRCETDGTVAAVPPAPPPLPSSWALTGQPPQVGGYGWLKNQGPCCNGLIVRIVDHGLTTDSAHTDWWLVQYYADPSGNFPASNFYWTTNQSYLFGDDLAGIAPAS